MIVTTSIVVTDFTQTSIIFVSVFYARFRDIFLKL